MDKKFKLINEMMKKPSKEEVSKTEKTNIKYQEYDLLVEGKVQTVLIPVRECDLFEETLEDFETINKVQLRKILFKHRGIRKTQ